MIPKTVLGPALALLATTAACATPTKIDIDLPIPGGGSISASFRGVDPNRVLDLGAPEEEEEEATCYEFTFLDEDGEELGSETTGLPGSVSVPEGTTEIQVEETDCEESPADGGPGRQAGKSLFVGRPWRLFGFPADPDIGAGAVLYSMTVRAPDIGSARAIRDQVLALGASGPLPPNVEIGHYSRTRLVGTDVVFTMGNDDPYRSLVFALNSNPAYATLDDTTLARVNGWYLATLVVPQSAFDYDPTPGATWSNTFEVRYTVAGASSVHRAGGRFEYSQ